MPGPGFSGSDYLSIFSSLGGKVTQARLLIKTLGQCVESRVSALRGASLGETASLVQSDPKPKSSTQTRCSWVAYLSAEARYFWRWKRFSSSMIWSREKDVRGFLRFGGVRFWYGCPIRLATEKTRGMRA